MKKPKLALQLYTLREAMEDDFSGTLHRIAEMGITYVETAFFPEGMTNQAAAQAIRDAGLTVCSAHCEIPLGDDQDAILAMVDLFDCDCIIWHGWPQDPRYSTVDGIKALADLYNEAHAVCAAHGKRFGIHNHWWEYQLHPALADSGKRPYQLLVGQIDPSIFFEVDTYWVQTAGVDPASVLKELGDRAPLLHFKDGPARPGTEEANMVALGQGDMDIVRTVAASNGNVEWLIIELDRCATDMFDAVAQSREYLLEQDLVLA